MCLTIGFFGPMFFKVLGFVLFCRAFAPLPFFARVSVLVTLCVFGAATGGGTCSVTQGLIWTAVLAEFAQGVCTGVVVSGVFYAIDLFCSWFLSLLLPFPRYISSVATRSLQGALFLTFLTLSAPALVGPFSELVFRLFSPGLNTLRPGLEIVTSVGIDALHLALILALPYVATVILLDISLFVMNRFLRSTARRSLQLGVRFPLLIMILSLLLYPHSDTIASHVVGFFTHAAPVGIH